MGTLWRNRLSLQVDSGTLSILNGGRVEVDHLADREPRQLLLRMQRELDLGTGGNDHGLRLAVQAHFRGLLDLWLTDNAAA